MRRNRNPYLGETTIKVPAPFAGINDLGFTAQYRPQTFNEPQRDVPLLFEGPESPLKQLMEALHALSATRCDTYAWTDPVMLSDEVVVLAFRDRSVGGGEPEPFSDGGRIAGYVLNLVQPVVFTFLHDCALVAHLKLSDLIEMRITAPQRLVAELALPIGDIVRPNGERLLFGLSAQAT